MIYLDKITKKDFNKIYSKSLLFRFAKKHDYKCAKCGLRIEAVKSVDNGNGGKCYILIGFEDNKHIMFSKDHIIPISKGGRTTNFNLQLMCEKCNSKKADKCNVFISLIFKLLKKTRLSLDSLELQVYKIINRGKICLK